MLYSAWGATPGEGRLFFFFWGVTRVENEADANLQMTSSKCSVSVKCDLVGMGKRPHDVEFGQEDVQDCRAHSDAGHGRRGLEAIAAKEKVAKEFGSDVLEGRYNPCF